METVYHIDSFLAPCYTDTAIFQVDAMHTYELLCVLPGTLAETEVEPAAAAVKALITDRGGMVRSFDDLGKTRLSYPMKHIRYGYFRLCRFDAEPKNVSEISKRLDMMETLLRAFVTKLTPGRPALSIIHFAATAQTAERGEAASVFAEAKPGPARVETDIPIFAPSHTPVSEKPLEEKRVKMEDIDKKLDEILEKDITDQL